MKIISFFCLLIILVGCGKFSDGTSVWSGGLWIIPVATFLGSLFFAYKVWKQHTGGSDKIINGKVTKLEGGKMPIYETPYFWYAVGLFVVTVAIIIIQNAEK